MMLILVNTLTELGYEHLYKCNTLLNALGNKNIPLLFRLFFDVFEVCRKTLFLTGILLLKSEIF